VTGSPGHPSQIRPLYAAGFTTAFGAHAIAANLAGYNGDRHGSLLALGILLAIYDGAEIILKPVFGALTDRIGAKPVLLGGLIAFAVASVAFLAAGNPGLLGLARLGQGAAASAFSPAASTLVARLVPTERRGRAFGGYGAYKGLGYTLGPLLGGALVVAGGFTALFAVMTGLALAVAAWATVAVPRVEPLPRQRQTLLDLARRLSAPGFINPTIALSASTAALAVGIGFLPARGHTADLGALATGATVSLMAATAALVQPRVGRAHDAGRITTRAGITAGLLLITAGLTAAALIPGVAGLIAAAVTIGTGTGLVTPLGFTAVAASTPPERLGMTMGAAEVGREAGDAGGPLLVGAVAAAVSLPVGLGVLAALVAASSGAAFLPRTVVEERRAVK